MFLKIHCISKLLYFGLFLLVVHFFGFTFDQNSFFSLIIDYNVSISLPCGHKTQYLNGKIGKITETGKNQNQNPDFQSWKLEYFVRSAYERRGVAESRGQSPPEVRPWLRWAPLLRLPPGPSRARCY